MRPAVCIIALSVVSVLTTVESQQQVTAKIAGRVVEGGTSASVAAAVVRLDGANAKQTTTVGSDGRFLFDGVPPGSYNVTASKPGFVGGGLGQRYPSDAHQSLEVRGGHDLTEAAVHVPLWQLAAFSGTVRGPGGQPLKGARVAALKSGCWPEVCNYRLSLRSSRMPLVHTAFQYLRETSQSPRQHLRLTGRA
jgi:hypothetical protein